MNTREQIPTAIEARPRKVVCDTCGASPLSGVPLFSPTPKTGEPRRRFCPEHLPLDEAKRHLGHGPHTLDADVASVFTRRLETEAAK